jgi:predicted nucleotidyltransferase
LRLSEEEIKIIKDVVTKFLNESKIYLFGSRLDDSKKGGDIDLFIVSKDIDYERKLKIRAKLKALLKKPVDVVYHKDFNREIEIEALKGRLL